jgi:hypothetical protein
MKDYPLKSLKLKNSLKIFIVFALLFIAGCAGEAGRVELPLNHPANPQAQESGFRPPQNPFQTDVAAMEEESTKDSTMKHKIPKESVKQDMGHKMGPQKESQIDSESKKKPAHIQSGDQHQEHNQ